MRGKLTARRATKPQPETQDIYKIHINRKHTWKAGEDPQADLVLVTKTREFHVRSPILRFVSPVFEAMLSHGFAEEKDRRVVIDDLTAENIEAFLNCFYYPENPLPLTAQLITQAYPAVHKYQVEALRQRCLSDALWGWIWSTEEHLAALLVVDALEERMQWPQKALQTFAEAYKTSEEAVVGLRPCTKDQIIRWLLTSSQSSIDAELSVIPRPLY